MSEKHFEHHNHDRNLHNDEGYQDDSDYSYEERVEKLVAMTVGVAKGIIPTGQITLLMLQIANGTVAPPEIRAFTRILLKIIKGERNPKIGAHLPADLAKAVEKAIDQIEAPLPEPSAAEAEVEELTLLKLLERIGEACTGNVMLWQQLWNFTETLKNAPTTPPDIKALGSVLQKILAGERQKQVTEALPTELAAPINELLDQLLRQSSIPSH